MNKEVLRKQYIAKRNKLSSEQVEAKSKAISGTFVASDIWKKYTVIHIFISIPDKAEVNTSYLIDFFHTQHPEIKLCTSILAENNIDLLHTSITPQTTYLPNKWNIPEPVERNLLNEQTIDLVLIPLLAFDANGNRVGYGKGFYDRFLQKCKPDVLKVGLSLFEPTEELIEADSWDVPLNWAATPQDIYAFK